VAPTRRHPLTTRARQAAQTALAISLLAAPACEPTPAELYASARSGVVTVVMVGDPGGTSDAQAGVPARRVRRIAASIGSGVLLDRDGHVATAAHVVDGAHRVGVVFDGLVRVRARVLGSDPWTDLAVLKVEGVPAAAKPLTLDATARPAVGDRVLAIGNPDGLPSTLTVGVVSGLHRRSVEDRVYHDFIQTDAALFPGNSGGPLLDGHGAVVGIVVGMDRGRRGAGFAVPAHRARPVLDRLRAFGAVRRSWIGATAKDLEAPVEAALGLGPGVGAMIRKIVADTPAARAGLLAGDVVVHAKGAPVSGRRSLAWTVALAPTGRPFKLGLLRSGRRMEVEITPEPRPEEVPPGGTHAF